MNHVFCTECGNKIEYSYSKPKFCSRCGTKCGGSVNNVETLDSRVVVDESLAEDETSIDLVPDIIGGLAVDIESYGNNVFTFDSLTKGQSAPKAVRNRGSKNLEDFINDKKG